jgi:hypothetical protein
MDREVSLLLAQVCHWDEFHVLGFAQNNDHVLLCCTFHLAKHLQSLEKQDTRCTYKVTLRRVRVTIVAVQKQ